MRRDQGWVACSVNHATHIEHTLHGEVFDTFEEAQADAHASSNKFVRYVDEWGELHARVSVSADEYERKRPV